MKKKRHIKDNGLDDTFVLGLVGLMFKSNFGFPSKDFDNSKKTTNKARFVMLLDKV